MTATPICRHWVGSDAKGHICGAPVDDNERLCAKHLAVEAKRVAKVMQERRARAERTEQEWLARNVPRLPQKRVQLERAQEEYERRTGSPIRDRAAVGGAMHASIVRTQARHLSDTNIARVVELERIIKTLRSDIERAERAR